MVGWDGFAEQFVVFEEEPFPYSGRRGVWQQHRRSAPGTGRLEISIPQLDSTGREGDAKCKRAKGC